MIRRATAASSKPAASGNFIQCLKCRTPVNTITIPRSMRDDEVINAANERGTVMVLTGVRHFRH